ncbi:hypothetical protein, partial [Streptomyces ipomoeae]|uniref:hypothetical protein n=1 Tax=Streptomyces ipomoeae TaxID=103232 RepID=UPI0029B7BED1
MGRRLRAESPPCYVRPGPRSAAGGRLCPAFARPARLRALLTVLALRPGRTVPAPALVDEVWAGDPPA